ncbi:AN1-type zinc finger protein 1-like isoform X2 [Daktulosphaira vitifoliae]|uniref:AN1-type zinc finger protein 1-like isoform X2 n=1 Tax=Daktulosphaira vitifoliae TaxID=58002 RepID=UPI0021AAA192|nr:AN1-type zinc finger protein 1-like isoform X2 [Daktulosphaira vitifoliae]
MEFPNFGKHCAYTDCKQLDFLPVHCGLCQKIFCSDHSRPDNHQCIPTTVVEDTGIKFETTWYKCTHETCDTKNPCEMLCPKCDKHYCLAHRHHGCLDELPGCERKKILREAAKKSKNQFAIVKEEADKKIEASLKQAELQPEKRKMAQQIRLMKLKSKALGDNKIPTNDRVYFSVHPPIKNDKSISAVPLFTSKNWTVGRTIDLFAVRLKIENRNDKKTMDCVFGRMITDGLIFNGDSLILHYVDVSVSPVQLDSESLEKYKLSTV